MGAESGRPGGAEHGLIGEDMVLANDRGPSMKSAGKICSAHPGASLVMPVPSTN
jgi:hypothetical protein